MCSNLQYIHVMATSREMTSGRPFPLILNFAFPLLLGNLLQQTYSLMDAAIVGKFLGINALASVGASTSVVFLILGFCNGCCGGFGIPVAQKFGARDYGMMRRFVAVSLQLAVVMSVVIAIVTSMFCSDILQMMQTPENILEDAYFYLLITFIGVPCTFFYNLLSSIIRALGDSKTPFWFLLFSTILNILLDLFCILVLDWGVAGAALATVFSQGVSAFVAQNYGAQKYDRAKKALIYAIGTSLCCGVCMFFLAFFKGDMLSSIFSTDHEVILAAWDYLKSYAIDCFFTAFLFCMIGFLNGCGKTTIVMIQGIVGAFFVRIPVAYVMSKIEPVSLFRVGLATPSSTIVQIVICGVYLFFLSRTLFKKEETNDAPNHELCDAEA